MGLILNSYGRKLPFKELMSLTIENLKKEAPVCLTMKTGSSVTLRNQIFFRQNLTQALHFFDPNEEDPEVAAFRHGLIVYNYAIRKDQRPDRPPSGKLSFLLLNRQKTAEKISFNAVQYRMHQSPAS